MAKAAPKKSTLIKMKPARSQADIAAGVRVIRTELDGLAALSKALDKNFADAVEAISNMKGGPQPGRLIVAGIGKSGHVARKIAATMASTGTPAYYIHPGEASHGDLGLIQPQDAVLVLSNSGENAELSDLIHYTRRYGMTMIAMTSNAKSALAQHADIVLTLPKAPEACPNGLAPTTSSTMMMALGDALAVVLLERMGLTREQFKVFHPGGKLGQKLMTVAELMIPYDKLPLVKSSALMDKALLMLTEKNMGAVLVVDKPGILAGIITDGDLKRHMAPNLLQVSVHKIMTKSPKTIQSDALAVAALEMMTRVKGRYLTSLVVMQGKKLVGMIRLQDCLQAGLS